MTRSYLPLNGLRTFEAAAEHMSFKRAAEDLGVTPAAVGHQVKRLEELLGVQLFVRGNRALALTYAGRACLPSIADGFDSLERALETIRYRSSQFVLNITVAPSFAAKWLIPRLETFRSRNPGVSVRLDTSMAESDLDRDGFDLGIRFGSGNYRGLRADRFLDEILVPVCSPKLLGIGVPLDGPLDLIHHSLLHIEGETKDAGWLGWSEWLSLHGFANIDASAGQRYSQSIMAVQAAIEGQGVALAPITILEDDLAAGRLVRLFREMPGIATQFGWYIAASRMTPQSNVARAFQEWIVEEAIRTKVN